jgi:hypothetical protein
MYNIYYIEFLVFEKRFELNIIMSCVIIDNWYFKYVMTIV